MDTVYYDSASRRSPMLSELRELLRYGDLLRLQVERITKNRYKRSALGMVWTLLYPLVSMVVMTVAFSTVFRTTGAHYPVYLLSGLVCWNFFAQTTVYAMTTLITSGALIKRVYVPCTIFGVAAVFNGLFNLALSLIPLVLIMAFLHQPFHAASWFVPVAVLVLSMFTLGVTLLLSTLAIFFPDVTDMFQLALQSWFFLTPIMYPLNVMPARFQRWMNYNPMYHLIELFRAPVLDGHLPAMTHVLWGSAWAVSALLVGWWAMTRKANEFAYRL